MPSESPIRSLPPFLAISDSYTEFVRSGKIQLVQGRLKGQQSDEVSIFH
jgi:hypothetical protein